MENTERREYQYTIKLCPVTKKNHQKIAYNKRTGARYITQSSQYKRYQAECGYFLKPVHKSPIDYPVLVKCLFFMDSDRRVDLNNLLAAATDILTDYGIIKDDNAKIVVSHDGSRVFYKSSNPRTEIYIEPAEMPIEPSLSK